MSFEQKKRWKAYCDSKITTAAAESGCFMQTMPSEHPLLHSLRLRPHHSDPIIPHCFAFSKIEPPSIKSQHSSCLSLASDPGNKPVSTSKICLCSISTILAGGLPCLISAENTGLRGQIMGPVIFILLALSVRD